MNVSFKDHKISKYSSALGGHLPSLTSTHGSNLHPRILKRLCLSSSRDQESLASEGSSLFLDGCYYQNTLPMIFWCSVLSCSLPPPIPNLSNPPHITPDPPDPTVRHTSTCSLIFRTLSETCFFDQVTSLQLLIILIAMWSKDDFFSCQISPQPYYCSETIKLKTAFLWLQMTFRIPDTADSCLAIVFWLINFRGDIPIYNFIKFLRSFNTVFLNMMNFSLPNFN